MNYKLEGSGETLVFIHGLSDNLLYWEYLADNLKNDYQVLRIDLRGHGESDLGNDRITIDTYVNDLHKLLDDLNISKIHLIGFSLGGAVAVEFTLRYPVNVNSLVLMSGFYKADDDLKTVFKRFRNALEISFENFYDIILPMVLCPEVIDNKAEELELLKEMALKNANTEAYIKAIDACWDFNCENQLADINVPTLLLAGKFDDITSLKSQKDMQSKISNSRLIIFDNVKHNLLIGKNNEKILNILKKEWE